MAEHEYESEEAKELRKAGGPAKPRPLSKREKAWIADLQLLLERCPKRLELVTTGCQTLTIVDGPLSRNRPIHDGWCARSGVQLDWITGGPIIHGVSG